MLLFGSIIVLKFVFLGPVEATKAESYSNNRLWKQVQLYSCTVLHNFFTWLTCQCFMQGMVFLCLVLEQILHHFIEMVFKSKLFFKFARVPILFCFEANDWRKSLRLTSQKSTIRLSGDLNPKKPAFIPEI